MSFGRGDHHSAFASNANQQSKETDAAGTIIVRLVVEVLVHFHFYSYLCDIN